MPSSLQSYRRQVAMAYAGLTNSPRELRRALQSPTFDDYAKLKHAIHYLKGTDDYRLTIQPDAKHATQTAFDVTTCVGSG